MELAEGAEEGTESFILSSVFGVEVDCCVTVEFVDICIEAGLQVPAYFVLASASSYIVCNHFTGDLIRTSTGLKLPPLSPNDCLDFAFASKGILESLADSQTG